MGPEHYISSKTKCTVIYLCSRVVLSRLFESFRRNLKVANLNSDAFETQTLTGSQ